MNGNDVHHYVTVKNTIKEKEKLRTTLGHLTKVLSYFPILYVKTC